MAQLISVAVKSFTSRLYEQGSWGARPLGSLASTMELFDVAGDTCSGLIEWDIAAIEDCEQIGLTYEWIDGRRHLIDYDGVAALPAQAADLLEAAGIVVDDDFKE